METIRLGARLRAARKAAGFKTSKSLLNKYKIPASTYSQHESGARIPDDEALRYYSKILFVNFEWLKLGDGLPYNHTKDNSKVFNEELLNIDKYKPNALINRGLLTSILSEVLQIHTSSISTKTINTIVKDVLKLYEGNSSLDTSDKSQAKILKSHLKTYKIKHNK